LLTVELLQIKYKSFAGYFSDGWNFFDVLHFLIYEIYFFIRIAGGKTYFVLPKKINDDVIDRAVLDSKMWWVAIHSLLVMLITFKLMFFMRVSENFSNLVKLVTNVMYQILPFTIFLMMWMVVNTILYDISGIAIFDKEDNDYHQLTYSVALILQNFRNSVGDITTPTYYYWTDPEVDNGGKLIWSQFAIVTWAWVLFLLNSFFILIVLLNFLIAIISQAYDEVMTKEEIERYKARADLNIEVAIKLDTFD
jgi:hypothetical protein